MTARPNRVTPHEVVAAGDIAQPLWSDEDIANDAKRASSNPTIQATIRSCLLFMRSGYEHEIAAARARIAELEAQLAEAQP